MGTRYFSARTSQLIAGVSLLGLLISACNRQPGQSATEAPVVAPPMAALPLATGTSAPAAAAPPAAALPPPARQIAYAPRRAREGYRYIDRAYFMGRAFGDTPPDYTVDYQETRPWIWRSGGGAYRIVERLPQGERIYYYDPGQYQPFLVRDPYYSYAYDAGELAAVYGPDGAELNEALAAQRADEASRYLARARDLYRAAQYERRQSAYASEWGMRRDQLQEGNLLWEQQQQRNEYWRAWHDEHEAEEQRQWRQERDQRLAYAAAIGLAAVAAVTVATASKSSNQRQLPDPAEVARRQAAYFSNWKASRGRTASQVIAARTGQVGVSQTPASPVPVRTENGAGTAQQQAANVQRTEMAAAKARSAQA
ncbi:MAG TPA: hypothetical protein VM711_05445, partial [Sphingomicrobium sp.]|nr:hypothetical protein [Sphingomicrobium sp.]